MNFDFEIIGTIAAVIVLFSAIFKSADKRKNIVMRLINAIGSAFFIIYGFFIGSLSIIILNFIMIGVCIFHAALLTRDLKKETINNSNSRSFTVDTVNVWANRSDDPNMSQIKHGVLGVDWAGSPGWGRWEMIMDENGVPHIYTEHMDKGDDKEFSKAVLEKVLEVAIIEE